ncbi:hypothetical protein VPH35_115125 [Triticum aestivum]
MSPAAPLDDENLLAEILLRLPPLPSTLPRASLVCKRWLLLVSDIRFFRRFRRRHRCSPPLLGCFVPDRGGLDHSCYSKLLGCRHGLLLIAPDPWKQILVCDPVTCDQHHIAFPPGFEIEWIANSIHGAVHRAAGVQHFQVILVGVVEVDKQHMGVLACVYSSDTGVWDNLISAVIPFDAYTTICIFAVCFTGMSALLVGNSLYWRLGGCLDAYMTGGLGLLYISGFTAQLWKRKTDCDGAASWGMESTIEVDKLLSLNPEKERVRPLIEGLAEYNNVVFLTTGDGVIMLQLESLQFKKFYEISDGFYHYPFESVYSAGTSIGSGHDGAKLLHNT